MNTDQKLIVYAMAAQLLLDARRGARCGVMVSCSEMGIRIHVQLRKKAQPIIFPFHATLEKTELELTIKGSTGEELGVFDRSEVVGYWKEHIPVNPKDVADEYLEDVVAKAEELKKKRADGSDAA
jgi:hypothetical protein